MENHSDRFHDLDQQSVVYRECMRNHAARLGSHATDGCGEFSGPAFQCAACGCHRNFHRKVMIITKSFVPATHNSTALMRRDGHNHDDHGELVQSRASGTGSGKRVRTKFTLDQKQRMLAFAERLGWRLQRTREEVDSVSDDEIERFCRGIGVSRKIFKVWMHNHKGVHSSSSSNSSTANNASSLTQ